MSIGISDEHVELAASLRKWAAGLGGIAAARACEDDASASFDAIWKGIGEMGVATIGLPESAGGGGGSVLDQAVAPEACAHELVPGPLLSTVVAASVLGEDARVALALDLSLEAVADLPGATHVLLPDAEDRWYVVPLQEAGLLNPSDQLRADVWELLNTRCLSIAGGTTQILRNVAGERILGLPR